MIRYSFSLESGARLHFQVELERQFDPTAGRDPHAPWTRLKFNQCENCPLREEAYPYCPAAIDLEQIATRFKDIFSCERAVVEVETGERTYRKECDVQTGLRSLLGLVMATSACPILSQFRGLAVTHLPFATLEETLFRSVGAYLLKQYFVYKAGGTPDLEMRGLEEFYKEVQTVNRCFKNRLNSAGEKEANLNAIGSLLYVCLGVSYSLADNLKQLEGMVGPATVRP